MRELTDILNWRRLDDRITLSGQPTEAQLSDLRSMGVTHVINLGPHWNKGALDDEDGSVTALGMTYLYIPVEFDAPTEADFETFCEALDGLAQTQVHIHCIYNARVTAFVLRRARSGRGGSDVEALALMEGIWRPGGVWAQFIGDDARVDQPHAYKGYDY